MRLSYSINYSWDAVRIRTCIHARNVRESFISHGLERNVLLDPHVCPNVLEQRGHRLPPCGHKAYREFWGSLSHTIAGIRRSNPGKSKLQSKCCSLCIRWSFCSGKFPRRCASNTWHIRAETAADRSPSSHPGGLHRYWHCWLGWRCWQNCHSWKGYLGVGYLGLGPSAQMNRTTWRSL